MNLKIKDICDLLNISEKTVYRWIKQEKIPVYKINHQYRFNRAEINEWILKNNMTVSENILNLKMTDKEVIITELIENGGIYYQVEGSLFTEVLENSLKIIKIPEESKREEVLELLLAREDMLPTTIGKGIAFPHPRSHLSGDVNQESVSVIFLNEEINYNSMDNIPLHTLFIIFSSNAKRHLEILSKLSFACQDDEFVKLLKARTVRADYIDFIKKKENEWQKRMRQN